MPGTVLDVREVHTEKRKSVLQWSNSKEINMCNILVISDKYCEEK